MGLIDKSSYSSEDADTYRLRNQIGMVLCQMPSLLRLLFVIGWCSALLKIQVGDIIVECDCIELLNSEDKDDKPGCNSSSYANSGA